MGGSARAKARGGVEDMTFKMLTIEHEGQWYVVLLKGCRRQFYQIKASAKKFSAQMEKVAESAVPAFVRRLFEC